jgi:hypothetical protein
MELTVKHDPRAREEMEADQLAEQLLRRIFGLPFHGNLIRLCVSAILRIGIPQQSHSFRCC